MKENVLNTILIVVGIVVAALIVAAGFANIPGTNISPTGDVQRNTISVVGEANLDIDPDKAEMYIQIETRGAEANIAQNLNAEKSDSVMVALKKEGISKDDIETDYFNLRPEYDWSKDKRELIGYVAEHTLRITTTDIENVGTYLDAAINAGANEIQRVDFGLTREKEKDVYSEALVRASSLAEGKATSITSSLGVRLGDIISVSESSSSYSPYRYYDYAVAEVAIAGASTKIAPEEVTVNGYVNLVFEIK